MAIDDPTHGSKEDPTATEFVTSAGDDSSSRTDPFVPSRLQVAAPTRVGSFEIRELIGNGGMGMVHCAYDPQLDRLVAIKVLLAGVLAFPGQRERFAVEARAIAKLDHRHIIPVYEFDVEGDQPYLVMKLITGGTVNQHRPRYLGQERLTAELMLKVARAVQHAHDHQILHRDLKPSNIFLDDQGEPLVGDFGLAKMLDASDEVTFTGAIMGTPAYMAPEQRLGPHVKLTFACDVYAFGMVLHELICGQRPIRSDASTESRSPDRVHEERLKLSETLSPGMRAIISRCLPIRPEDRYQTMSEVAEDLERFLAGHAIAELRLKQTPQRIRAQRLRVVTIAATAVLCVLLAAVLARLVGPKPPHHPEALPWIAAEFERDKKVALLDAKAEPRWKQILTPETSLTTARDGETNVLVMRSDKTGFVDVGLGSGIKAYRLTADIRIDEAYADGPSYAGLYVGRSLEGLPGKEFHCMIRGHFSESRGAGGQANVEFQALLWRVDSIHPSHLMESTPAKLANPVGSWRRVALDFKTTQLSLAVDEQVIFPRDRAELLERVGRMTRSTGPDLAIVAPPFSTDSAFGLYLQNCRASIKNVYLLPIPSP